MPLEALETEARAGGSRRCQKEWGGSWEQLGSGGGSEGADREHLGLVRISVREASGSYGAAPAEGLVLRVGGVAEVRENLPWRSSVHWSSLTSGEQQRPRRGRSGGEAEAEGLAALGE